MPRPNEKPREGAYGEFQAAIEKKMAEKKVSRGAAAAMVARENPELRQRVVDEANDK